MSQSFEPSDRTRIRRKPMRGSFDEETIFRILDAGVICHIAYAIDGQAYVTPTAYWRHGRRLYWHGSAASRMLRAQANGLPVCVAVSHLDGFVLARTGFTHSLLYRSVMAFGRASLVADADEKQQALHAFIDRLFPRRSRELRPMKDQELAATSLVAMTIEEATAKIRDGGVIDREEDHAFPCWAGVIPVRQSVGRIAPDDRLVVPPSTPANLAAYAESARLDEVLLRLADANQQQSNATP